MNAEQIIREILLKKRIIKSEEEFIPSATLETLDLDSLDVLDIIFGAEGMMQIKFPDIRDNPPKTLQDMINLVQGLIDNPPPVRPEHVNIEGQPKIADIIKNLPKD